MTAQALQIEKPSSSNEPSRLKFPILKTKLNIPSSYHTLVERPTLNDKLKDWQSSCLTVVTAPAGFGKSTLLGEWARQQNSPCAWLSLDDGDNDPFSFLNYLIAALQNVNPRMGDELLMWLQGKQLPALPPFLGQLLEEVSEQGQAFVLILDDYHLMTNDTNHEIVEFLLAHKPPFFHMMIAGRTSPPFPLSRLRARQQLIELNAADLSFSLGETETFLNSTMALGLNKEQIGALETRTEGWAAGLQLAALSIRGQDDISEFIASFAGNDRYIADFLVEEVLSVQSETIQKFLLQTSILESLSGPLCDAVLGKQQGQQMLLELEKKDLFLIPLDNQRLWFRYHHLFSEALQQLLKERYPESLEELHENASCWYEAEGQEEAAMHHALEAKNYERFTCLFERLAEHFATVGRYTSPAKWLEKVPPFVFEEFPILRAWAAWGTLLQGDINGLMQNMAQAKSAIQPPEGIAFDPTLHDPSGVSVHLNAIMLTLAWVQGDVEQCLLLASPDALPTKNQLLATSNLLVLGLVHMNTGKLEEADKFFDMSMQVFQKNQMTVSPLLLPISSKCHIKIMQGRLKDAEELANQGIALGIEAGEGTALPTTGFIYFFLALVFYERNELKASAELAQKILTVAQQSGEPMLHFLSYLILIRLEEASGNPETVLKYLEGALSLAPTVPMFLEAHQIAAQSALVHLNIGKRHTAVQWKNSYGMQISDPPNLLKRFEQTVFIRVLLAEGKRSDALALLDPFLALVKEHGYVYNTIELSIVKALALVKQDLTASLESLNKALVLAESEKFIRLFVNEGEPMKDLLSKLSQSSLDFPKSFVRVLLEHLEQDAQESPPHHLFEALSERERTVLGLIAQGYSNQKIGKELYVSLNTVKTHTRNIYSKLEVRSRTEATVKALGLKLI